MSNEQQEIATLKANMKTIITRIETMDHKLDKLIEANSKVLLLEKDVETLRGEIINIRRSKWIQNTLSAIFGAVLTLLITYIIQDIVRR